jgi:hypothetical protein
MPNMIASNRLEEAAICSTSARPSAVSTTTSMPTSFRTPLARVYVTFHLSLHARIASRRNAIKSGTILFICQGISTGNRNGERLAVRVIMGNLGLMVRTYDFALAKYIGP